MAIQAYLLDLPGSPLNHGVVLVNSLYDLPIPIPVFSFRDLDDADRFVEWAIGVVARPGAEQWASLANDWVSHVRDNGCRRVLHRYANDAAPSTNTVVVK